MHVIIQLNPVCYVYKTCAQKTSGPMMSELSKSSPGLLLPLFVIDFDCEYSLIPTALVLKKSLILFSFLFNCKFIFTLTASFDLDRNAF